MNKKWKTRLIVMSCMLLAAMFVLSGCSYSLGDSTNGNKILTVSKGLKKFSFEYNPIYKLDHVYVEKDFTIVFLNGPKVGEVPDYTNLLVEFVKLKPGESGYQKFLEDEIRVYSPISGYKFLDRFPIEVAGLFGEELIYFNSSFRSSVQIAKGIAPNPTTTRVVMFADNTVHWSLKMVALQATADSDGLNFDHIVKTFKILK